MKVTDSALAQFKNAIKENDTLESGIRLFASQGCCGPSVQISVVERVPEGDTVVSIGGVDFYVESKAEQILTDVTIDFSNDGFKLEGLKKSGSCC